MASTDDLTDRLMKRAEHDALLLLAHLDDNDMRLYTGRATAAHRILAQIARDHRRHEAELKQARKRRRVIKRPPSETVHERH